MRNYIQDGDRITITAGATITSGQVVLFGDVVGVAMHGAASGEAVTLVVEGVVRLRKASGTINPGVRVFWDNTASRVTTTPTGNRPLGFHAGRAANSGADNTDIEVLLKPSPIATA